MNLSKFGRLLGSGRSNYVCVATVQQHHQVRWLSTGSTRAAKPVANRKPDWNRAVSEAEKIVGYPTSFLNLRWLLSDEVANVALHLRKLVGSDHPLLKTAKSLLYNGKNNMQAWGLIVLLVSKAAGHSSDAPDLEQDKAAGVLQSQRMLAEITEMIRTSQLIHKGLVNLQPFSENDPDMLFGNKIALLSGDYLLSNSCTELANLKNQDLTEIISAALRDQTECEFLEPRDVQNNPLPARPQRGAGRARPLGHIGNLSIEPLAAADVLGDAEAEWTLRHVLGGGSLLGKSCQGALMLAGHPQPAQHQAYLFGKHLALAWQACLDRKTFQRPRDGPFSLVSAPLMFQLEHEPALYAHIERGRADVADVDYDLLYEAVRAGPGLRRTLRLQAQHSRAALRVLQQLPPTDARTALTNIIHAMQDL